jgi:hypothetical protein
MRALCVSQMGPGRRRTLTIMGEPFSGPRQCSHLKKLSNIRGPLQIDEWRAKEIWAEVVSGVSQWRQVATSYGISASEQKRFAPVLDRYLST